MQVSCFEKMELSSAVCGVHQAKLEFKEIAIDPNAPGLGRIPCHVCPISQAVVREVRWVHARKSL
jgi:hypothetical protein